MLSLRTATLIIKEILKAPVVLRNASIIVTSHVRHGSEMPKKASGGKTGNKKSSAKDATASSSSSILMNKTPISVGKTGDISISIQVKPGAKTDAITDISDTSVGVQISAPPVDGEANTAIVKYFAEILKLKKTDVSVKGGKSRQKTVLVSSSADITTDKITSLLQAEHQQR